jgi:peptide/nickel transport system permease protein
MVRMIAVRLMSTIPVLLLVALLSFFMLHLMPGSPAASILGNRASPERIKDLEQRLGLDVPIWEQFVEWFSGILSGNFGTSITRGVPVSDLIQDRLVATMSLALAGSLVAVGVGLAVGTACAVWRDSILDRGLSVLVSIGLALPEFWIGLILLSLFAVEMGWFPVISWTDPRRDVVAWLQGLILPALALGLPGAASIARQMRDAMIEALDAPYVQTLRALGTTPRTVALRFAMKNAIIPVITVIGFYTVMILGGSFVIEKVFSIPGIGALTIDAINDRDMPVVQAVTLLIALLVVAVYLVIDLTSAAVNPRWRSK